MALDLFEAGVEPELVADAERLEVFPDVVVPVASLGHLLALKLLARDDVRRPQDLVDIEALLAAGGAGHGGASRSGA